MERKEYIMDIQWSIRAFDDTEARKEFKEFLDRLKSEFPIKGSEIRIRRTRNGMPPVTVAKENI